jgi:glycosyltransferase involved in cell wall biosynthesis
MMIQCSIVITSYNKAEYVGLAVDSALAQTWPNVEVVVIDDGSQDNSVKVLKEFGNRIRLVAKANGGQASAMNRGFALSSGAIVFFLDCDDLLAADTVERVMVAWRPEVSKAHFKLRRINGSGAEIGGPPLPPYRDLPHGDLSALLYQFGFYPAPPTSGNAFARRFLNQVMPIPEDVYHAWPDTYLSGTAPLFGQIVVISGCGGAWRTTDTNHSKGGLDMVEARLRGDREYIKQAGRLAALLGRDATIPAKWPHHLKDRLIVAKFAIPAASNWAVSGIVKEYLVAVWAWPEYSLFIRARFMLWALFIALMPARLLRRLPGVAGPNIKFS